MSRSVMSEVQDEVSLDSITEDIKTGYSDPNQKQGDSDDVILESIDESDISSVESLPDDLAKSTNYTGRSYSFTSDLDAELRTAKSTARTPRTQRTISYSDDFEIGSLDPRGAVSEPQTARTIPSTAYSSDFESTWQNEKIKAKHSTESIDTYRQRKPKPKRSVSLDVIGRSYSAESFESETDRTESSESESVSTTRSSISPKSLSIHDDDQDYEDESSASYTDLSFKPDSDDERRFIDAKYDFFVKKLMLLERKNRGEYSVKPPARPEEKESTRQKRFCQKKVEFLRGKYFGTEGHERHLAQAAEPVRPFDRIANDPVEEHGIPEAALHRLQLQNTMHNMKKAAEVKIHKPKNCRDCREKLAQVTEKSFLQQKLAVVSEKLLRDKLVMQANPALEFANGLKDLPSHKDDPSVVFDRLMKTAQRKYDDSRQNISVAVQTVESKPPEPVIKHLQDYTEDELKLNSMELANEPREQFWNKYFEPLKGCEWFPKSS